MIDEQTKEFVKLIETRESQNFRLLVAKLRAKTFAWRLTVAFRNETVSLSALCRRENGGSYSIFNDFAPLYGMTSLRLCNKTTK
jgi:hypothetical protein